MTIIKTHVEFTRKRVPGKQFPLKSDTFAPSERLNCIFCVDLNAVLVTSFYDIFVFTLQNIPKRRAHHTIKMATSGGFWRC
jgi:hypothetical protein